LKCSKKEKVLKLPLKQRVNSKQVAKAKSSTSPQSNQIQVQNEAVSGFKSGLEHLRSSTMVAVFPCQE